MRSRFKITPGRFGHCMTPACRITSEPFTFEAPRQSSKQRWDRFVSLPIQCNSIVQGLWVCKSDRSSIFSSRVRCVLPDCYQASNQYSIIVSNPCALKMLHQKLCDLWVAASISIVGQTDDFQSVLLRQVSMSLRSIQMRITCQCASTTEGYVDLTSHR